jgi:hypothetical protein
LAPPGPEKASLISIIPPEIKLTFGGAHLLPALALSGRAE